MASQKARKKKRIAKHIVRAQDRKRQEEHAKNGTMEPTAATATTTATIPKKKKKKSQHVKDPKEAQSYLSSWKYRDLAPGTWKFNTNTQSWLFRHMYDSDEVPKASFAILMDYLQGLKGRSRDWANEDAVRRVLRYKEWEKKGTDAAADVVEGDGSEKQEAKDGKDDDDDSVNDDKRFQNLSDHEKRKEYKRARKVVETIKDSAPVIEEA
jgi:hypothetical protein